MFRKRTLAFLCVAVAAGCVLTAVASTAPPEPVQAPPSIASTLSPSMAATPGIVAFLSSSAPKAVEFNPSTGQTVWVGRGTVTWTATGVNYAPGGVTIAGTYQAPTYPGASKRTRGPIPRPHRPCQLKSVTESDRGWVGSGVLARGETSRIVTNNPKSSRLASP
jgi:hypothetical protein